MTQRQSKRRPIEVVNNKASSPWSVTGQDLLTDLEPDLGRSIARDPGRNAWIARVRAQLGARSPDVLDVAEEALRAWATDPEQLLLAALAALAVQLPARALGFLKRYGKRYLPGRPVTLLTAIAMAQQGHWTPAWTMLQAGGLSTDRAALPWFVGDAAMDDWLFARLREIRAARSRAQKIPKALDRAVLPRVSASPNKPAPLGRSPTLLARGRAPAPAASTLPVIADLPKLEAAFDITFQFANPDAVEIAGTAGTSDHAPFQLRRELVRLSLFEGFDELLCLPALRGVEAHWYQVETVRKVLKQYRGRVLLADEVGLGKTVEAGMVL